MAYDPTDPNTWNEPVQPSGGLIDAQLDQSAYGVQNAPVAPQANSAPQFQSNTQQNYWGASSPSIGMTDYLNILQSGNQNATQPTPVEQKPKDDTFLGNLGTSLSEMLKQNGGAIFANTMSGSAAGVLGFLAARRQSRGNIDLQNLKNQQETQAKNADVARASAMPTVSSVVRPTVTGTQKVGSQRPPAQQGLISATSQRRV